MWYVQKNGGVLISIECTDTGCSMEDLPRVIVY